MLIGVLRLYEDLDVKSGSFCQVSVLMSNGGKVMFLMLFEGPVVK